MTDNSQEERLRTILKGRDVTSAGALQIINLEKVWEHMGASSERVFLKIRSIMQSVLDRHLGPYDLGMWLSNLAYVIVFGKAKLPEAEIKVHLIAAEISRRLLGDQADVHEMVQVMVVPVDTKTPRPADILGAFELLLLHDVSDLLGNADENADEDIDPPWQTFSVKTGQVGDDEISGSDGSLPSEQQWVSVPKTIKLPAGLRFSYRPIWDVQHKVLSTYSSVVSLPRCGDDNAEAILGNEPPEFMVELDLLMLTRVVDDLTRLHQDKRRVLIACPLHVATLSNRRAREKFVRTYHPLPDEIRRDIIFELIGQWEGMPQSRLIDLMACVKPVSRSVVALVDIDWTRFDLLRDGGISRVGIDLSRPELSETQLLPLMGRFVERANKGGMKTTAHGLSSNSLAVGALGAGFDFVEGAAIHGPVETAEHIFRFHVENLFTELLDGIRHGQQ